MAEFGVEDFEVDPEDEQQSLPPTPRDDDTPKKKKKKKRKKKKEDVEVEDNPLFPAAADELDGVEIGEIGEEIEDGLADLETYVKDSTEMSEQGEAPRAPEPPRSRSSAALQKRTASTCRR